MGVVMGIVAVAISFIVFRYCCLQLTIFRQDSAVESELMLQQPRAQAHNHAVDPLYKTRAPIYQESHPAT
jgi:hypothetical protein